MEATLYSKEGKKAGTVTLPQALFDVAWNDSLIHQVVTSMQDNARASLAHTKGRGEVRGGGKKPWRQKGTGRARHGSIRSPIWRGGGVTHGPRKEKVFARAIPKKMRAKALFMALSRKFRDGEILFVDSFGLASPKTAEAKKALRALSRVEGFGKLATKKKNAALVAFPARDEAARKSFSNIGNVECAIAADLNPMSVLKSAYLIVENPEAALAIVASRLPTRADGKTAKEPTE